MLTYILPKFLSHLSKNVSIEKHDDVDYHDKSCYYLVHAMKRHREFGLLHDRMLNEKRRNESNLLKFFGSQKDFVFAT